MHTLTLAYSPCPNDTFMFCALAEGRVGCPSMRFETRLHDVETLNEHLGQATFDVSKASFHAWLRSRETYALLDAGAALGFGCGPLLVARSAAALADPAAAAAARIAVPGRLTTAALLLGLWNPALSNRLYLPYDAVIPAVLQGRADAGLVIHESRFVYRDAGLQAVADLGAWWERVTGLPLPLGCIVARRSLGAARLRDIENLLRASIEDARRHPAAAHAYVMAHAVERSPEVVRRHIDTFVNAFSLRLGTTGREAVERLAAMLRAAEGGAPP